MGDQVTDFYDLLAPETRADPYQLYQRMRKEAPISWSEQLQSWVIVRYRDVFPLLRDPCLSTARPWREGENRAERGRPDLLVLRKALARWLTFLDPPDPIAIRAIADHVFTPVVVGRVRRRLQRLVDALIDQTGPRQQIDVIRDLARPLSAMTLTMLLGAPAEDRPMIFAWADQIGRVAESYSGPAFQEQAGESLERLTHYYEGLIARLPDRSLDALLRPHGPDLQLSEAQEMLASAAMFTFAGHATTQNLIGNAMATLLRHPEQLCRLKEHPALTIMALEELMRYESPIQYLHRVALMDTDVEDQVIQKGQMVLLCIGSANRDPEQFRNAEQLDIGRANNRHLTFGQDAHFSFSAALTRLVGQTVIETLVRRLESPRLVGETLEWQPDLIARGLASLPVSFDRLV